MLARLKSFGLARIIQTAKQEADAGQTSYRKEEKQVKFTVNTAGQMWQSTKVLFFICIVETNEKCEKLHAVIDNVSQ